jgi:hypothetical protein
MLGTTNWQPYIHVKTHEGTQILNGPRQWKTCIEAQIMQLCILRILQLFYTIQSTMETPIIKVSSIFCPNSTNIWLISPWAEAISFRTDKHRHTQRWNHNQGPNYGSGGGGGGGGGCDTPLVSISSGISIQFRRANFENICVSDWKVIVVAEILINLRKY